MCTHTLYLQNPIRVSSWHSFIYISINAKVSIVSICDSICFSSIILLLLLKLIKLLLLLNILTVTAIKYTVTAIKYTVTTIITTKITIIIMLLFYLWITELLLLYALVFNIYIY